MNSMKIGTYQMDTTFGLYLPEYTIPAPAVQTNFVKIIGRDGSVDLSNALGLHYDSRTWSLDFKCFDPTVNWHTLSSQVMNAIHGKRLNFEFDDDPNYFWTGRVSVQNYVSSHGTGTLKVTIVSDPFKYAKLSTIVTKTASTGTEYTGSMVTFNDGLIYDLSADIEPIQDLHGYANPWPGGAGINKLSPAAAFTHTGSGITLKSYGDGRYTLSGTATASFEYLFDIPEITMPDTVYIHLLNSAGSSSNSAINFDFYNGSTRVDFLGFGTTANRKYNGTSDLGGKVINKLKIRVSNGEAISGELSFSPMALLVNDTVAFSPYANICPISGRTGLNVYRTGKNLIPSHGTGRTSEGVTYTINSDGSVSVSGTATASSWWKGLTTHADWDFIKAGTYKLTGGISSSKLLYIVGKYVDGTVISNLTVQGGVYDRGSGLTFTLPQDAYISYQIQIVNGTECDDTFYPMIRLATDEDDTFEPYNGNTYAVDWTSEAGTVYGGTLDVITGLLTVDKSVYRFTGSESWALSGTSFFYTFITEGLTSAGGYFDTENGVHLNYNKSNGQVRVYLNQNSFLSTSSDMQDYCPSGIGFLYTLATPLTYQLTAQEVEALVGTNNVWSDGGNVTVAVVTPETLTNNGRAVVPTLTASADMVLKWGNYSASVQQGTSTIPQLILENGANLIYIIGTGSISFTWQEASL